MSGTGPGDAAAPAQAAAPAEGLLVVDKPAGWTSHDVVARIRRLAGTRRVGHAGTLDPDATGVLVVALGRATRLLGHLSLTDKEYLATIRLGVRTSTDDTAGEVLEERPVDVDDARLRVAVGALTGELSQVPPAVSAVKVAGRRAYRLAREGAAVELSARPVQVEVFEVLRRDGPDVDARVVCSSGTYVRALARDLGAALGTGGHLRALRRTRVGPYTLATARTLDQLAEGLPLVSLREAVATSFPRRELDADEARRLANGMALDPVGAGPAPVGAFGPDGEVVALVSERDGMARPLVVFAPGVRG